MIVWLILGVVIILALFLHLYVIPKRALKWQVEQFEKRGYKVLAMPYSILNPPIRKLTKGSKADSMAYMKEIYPQYDVVIFNNNTQTVIDISDPELTRELIQSENKGNFIKSRGFAASIQRVAGMGLTFLDGETWKKRRRALNEVFNFDFLKSMVPKLDEIADLSLKEVEEESVQTNKQEDKNCFEYNALDYTLTLASNAMVEIFFGQNLRNEKIFGKKFSFVLNDLIDTANQQARSIFFVLFGVGFMKLGLRKSDREYNQKLKIFCGWGRKILEERIKEIKKQNEENKNEDSSRHKDIIEALLQLQQKEKSNLITEDELFDEFRTFFLAGVQTTASFLMTMILLVLLNPEIEKKIREEIDQFMKEDDYSYENLKKFTYIEKVQKEAIRMYGPATGIFSRYAVNDTFIKDVPVMKDARVRYTFAGVHMNQKYYKNPFQFRPERWGEQSKDIPAFAVNGFNAGPRTCIGKHFALIESKLGLIKFLKRYHKAELQIEKPHWIFGFTYKAQSCPVRVFKS